MRERKQPWVWSVFQGVTWEWMVTGSGCGGHQPYGRPRVTRLGCCLDQLHQKPQSQTPVAGAGGQWGRKRSSYRQTCGKPKGMCPSEEGNSHHLPQLSTIRWGCGPAVTALMLFIPWNSRFLCEVSRFLSVNILFNNLEHRLWAI